MATTTRTVTVKVKKHPREMYYPGQQTRDHLEGLMKWMASKPIWSEPDKVRAFLETVKPEDTVGVEHHQYKVTSIDSGEPSFTGIRVGVHSQEYTIGVEQLTTALGMGFCEILYRNGIPYGIETTKEVKLITITSEIPKQ